MKGETGSARLSSARLVFGRNSILFSGSKDGRYSVVSERHHNANVIFDILTKDGQDRVENVLLGLRQSGQRRLDDKTNGFQLLDSMATLN